MRKPVSLRDVARRFSENSTQFARDWSERVAKLAVPALAAFAALTVGAKADPGTPGVPQAPITIYTENAQNRPGPTPIVRLNAYTGATGQSYTANPAWLSSCNGWIASANQPVDAAVQVADCAGVQQSWNMAQRLSWALGLHAGLSQTAARDNYSVSAYTSGNPGAGLVEFQTATNIAFPTSNRFVSFSVDVAAVNCAVSAPLLQFSLVDDGGEATPAGSQINACASGTAYGVPGLGVAGGGNINAGTYASNEAVLISGSSVGVRMVNNNGSGAGNDHAFDNISILDATPQLDKEFSPTAMLVGATSTLTFTITNTSELGAKSGWSFTDTLPAGLTVASDEVSTTCPAGVVTAAAGGATIDVSGNLTAGMASCTATVPVRASAPGSYTNDASNITSSVGINPPGDTTVTVTGQPNFGMCDSRMFLAQNNPTQLFQFDTSSNPFIVNPMGPPASFAYNAVAMHPVDNYIYGLRGPAPGTLVRVGADGSVVDLGTIAGFPTNSVLGEIGPDGTYYVADATTLYAISLDTMQATPIALSQNINGQDLAWHNGRLYVAEGNGGQLYAINPSNGNVAAIGPTGVPSGFFGGMFGATNGVFGSNNDGGFYQFDPETGAATLISDLPGSGNNDGAKCVTTPLNFPSDLSITKDDGTDTYANGTDTTYTIVVTNHGPFGVQGAEISDPLPAGISEAIWTCEGAAGGVCGVVSGTGGIETTANLPVGGSVTYTLSIGIPNTYTGALTNTATVMPPEGSVDPDLSNNEASDTDTQEDEPPVSGACTPVQVGGASSFPVSPFPINATYSGTGSLTARPATKSWGTSGGNFTWTINFAQPIPAQLLQFRVIDVNTTSDGAPYNPVITVSVNGGATPADFSKSAGDLQYNSATGRLSYSGNPYRQAVTLTGNSQSLVSTLRITATNINPADFIALGLWSVPGCVTVQKISSEDTGSFGFEFENVLNENSTSAAGTSLTTAEPDVAVSSETFYAMPGAGVTLSEVVPAGWNLETAACTDQNAGITGNPTSVGVFDAPAISIPGDNVRPRSDLRCLFTNEVAEPALEIEKTGTLNDLNGNDLIDPGETITYSFLVTNTGNVALTDVTVDDPLLSDAGIDVEPEPQTLAPGGSVTFEATYQPTQADIDSGSVTNTATGTGTPPGTPPIESPPDEVTVPPNPESGLTIEKTGTLNDLNGNDLIDPGETITYSFLVTNNGAVTLTDVTVNDPLLTNAGISVSPGPQTLAPGGSVTFEATYQPTQAEIDSGSVTNTATGTGTPPDGPPTESPPDDVTVPPNREPSLTIDKTGQLNDLNGNDLIDPGETITYSFRVTNTGAVTLTDVTVDDPLLTDAGISVSPGPQTLAPGGSVTFQATYQPTQVDIDSGSVTNTATGIGTPPDGPPIESPPDEETVPPNPEAGLTIEKTGQLNDLNGNDLIDPGETITYSFLVTNTGAVTLTDVTVDDPMLADAGISVTPAPQTLAPGGSITFTATYEPTQADIDSGSVTNTATGTGTPPDGPPTESPPDEVIVPPNPESGLTIDKTGTLNDLNGNDLIDAGETITYSFLVTNTGAVTMTDVTVNDPMLEDAGISVTPGPQTLAPGDSATFEATYQPTQADIDSGSVTNTATGTGTPPDGPPTESPPDEVTVPPNPEPGLTIEKTGRLNDLNGNALIDAGETITYSFLVTNTGAVTMTDVTVDDPMLADAGISVSPGPQTLTPGGSVTFTATYQPTQADIDSGSVTNTATGTGTPPDGPPIESPPDEVTVPPNPESSMTIEKTGQLNDLNGNALIDPGETITYSFLVTNTGAVTLTDVTVNDPLLADAGIPVSPGPQTLAPGGSVTFTATYQPTQADIDSGSVTNTATGTGTPPDGPPIESPPDEVTVPPNPESGLVIEKTGTLNDANGNALIDLGETITYSFLVTNNGAVTLTDVTVDDPMLANAGISITPGPQTLAPGGSVTFSATYQPTQADIDAGSVRNVATGTGTPPDGPPVESPPDEVTVPPDDTPGMTIEKTGQLNDLNGNDLIDAGETITYSFLVTNTGTVTLTDVTVDDPMLVDAGISVSPDPQTLAPGGSVTFSATYQPTQADIDAGSVTNTATGTGTPPDGPPVESPPDDATVPPNPDSGLTIEKTGELNDLDTNGLLDPGETITYSFLVTNTGAVTLTDVTVNDPMLEAAGISVTPEPQTLAPGENVTFTAVYAPTDAEIEAGSVTNTATGIGTPPDGPPVESPPDTVTVPEGRPGIGIVKTGEYVDTDGNGQANVGDELHYTFVVTNTGNILLSDVVPQDEGPSFNGIRGTGSLSAFTPAGADLQPGAEQTYTATYVLTQADIDNGAGVEDGVENTANAVGYANGDEITGRPIESDESVVVIALPAPETDVSIIKIADLRYIRRGEQAPFTIRVTNNGAMRLDGFTVTDTLPSGFRYVDGSATVDGVEVTPVVSGRQVIFENLTVEADSEMVIRLRMLALSSAGAGKHTNRASIRDRSGNPIAPDTDAVVEILVEPIFDCGDIIGKVFDDVNRNGYQDDGEPGMPGVRIATAKGWLVTTDQYGRFHVPCAALPDSRIGSNFIMKLDERTLPTGYRLTTENPRVVRLTAGKMTKLNFGVSIGRVVRLDLRDEAFEAQGTDLRAQWAKGVDQLIALLRQEQSVLRLSYIDAGTDDRLAEERVERTKQLITERWRRSGGQYRLEIETRVEVGQ